MSSDYVVCLSGGNVIEPDNVTILESGWVQCKVDRKLVRYPPRRVDRVETLSHGPEREAEDGFE